MTTMHLTIEDVWTKLGVGISCHRFYLHVDPFVTFGDAFTEDAPVPPGLERSIGTTGPAYEALAAVHLADVARLVKPYVRRSDPGQPTDSDIAGGVALLDQEPDPVVLAAELAAQSVSSLVCLFLALWQSGQADHKPDVPGLVGVARGRYTAELRQVEEAARQLVLGGLAAAVAPEAFSSLADCPPAHDLAKLICQSPDRFAPYESGLGIGQA